MHDLLKNTSIRKSLSILIGALGLFLVLMAVLSFSVMEKAHRDNEEMNRIGVIQANDILNANIQRLRGRTKLGLYFDNAEKAKNLSATETAARLDEISAHVKESKALLQRFGEIPAGAPEASYVKDVVASFTPAIELLDKQVQLVKAGDFAKSQEIGLSLQTYTKDLDSNIKAYMSFSEKYSNGLLESYNNTYTWFIWLSSILLMISAAVFFIAKRSISLYIIKPLSEALSHLEYMSKADLSTEIKQQGDNEVGQLIKAMIETQDKLKQIVSTVRDGSSTIYSGVEAISAGNNDLSSRTEEQAASLEETAASMEQMTATVKQNADNSRNASGLARDASTTVDRGKNVVLQVVDTMKEISDGSLKISQIIGVIDAIAFQTNILALNASVEAARAGEQGRGFAVVANEVRNLAGKSADAAREIKLLINDSTLRVNEGAKLVQQAGSTMDEVVQAVCRVTDIIDEISSASQEQSEGIGQINEAIAQMDEVTQQNSSLVQKAASASASLREESHKLEQAVSVFNLGTGYRSTPKPAQRSPGPLLRPDLSAKREAATESSGEWTKF
jgi:methyl-accepting chemotaxis protein-2 (aspartate sensor receptor)